MVVKNDLSQTVVCPVPSLSSLGRQCERLLEEGAENLIRNNYDLRKKTSSYCRPCEVGLFPDP